MSVSYYGIVLRRKPLEENPRRFTYRLHWIGYERLHDEDAMQDACRNMQPTLRDVALTVASQDDGGFGIQTIYGMVSAQTLGKQIRHSMIGTLVEEELLARLASDML